MSENVGERLLARVQELKQNFVITESKTNVYSFTVNDFNVRIVAIPGKEISIDLELIDSGRPLLSYGVDNDLYDLKDPSSYSTNKSIEDEILDIIDALKQKKIVVGYRKNRKAFALPLRDEAKLVYRGMFVVGIKTYKNYDELLESNEFVPA